MGSMLQSSIPLSWIADLMKKPSNAECVAV